MNVKKDFSRQLGLGAMAEELGVEFTPHRAVDDAYATMRVCEALIRRENADTVPAFVERYHIRAGQIAGYKITPLASQGLRSYLAERDEEREKRAKAHDEFYRYVNKYMHSAGCEVYFPPEAKIAATRCTDMGTSSSTSLEKQNTLPSSEPPLLRRCIYLLT